MMVLTFPLTRTVQEVIRIPLRKSLIAWVMVWVCALLCMIWELHHDRVLPTHPGNRSVDSKPELKDRVRPRFT